jgi:hypothetical protein
MSSISRDDLITELRETRARLRSLRARVDTPAVYQALKVAEMHLHWAQWLLLDLDEILPELEETPTPPS